MSESSETNNENNNRKGGAPANEEELATRQVQIQSKRFYIDVKQNKRGRFIKLAEVGVGGRKSRIILSMGAADEFKKHLGEFSEFHSNMGPSHGGASSSASGGDNQQNQNNNRNSGGGNNENDGLLKSATINRDRKRYYLDLKENQRGRFLRVSMVMNTGPRAQIAIPAQGLIEFKDHLTELLEQYGTKEESKDEVQLPESKFLRADSKTFYFDCGSNARGVFLRLSEVRQYRYRSSITIPEKYWEQFTKNINEFIENVKQERQQKGIAGSEKKTDATPAPDATANASAPVTAAAAAASDANK